MRPRPAVVRPRSDPVMDAILLPESPFRPGVPSAHVVPVIVSVDLVGEWLSLVEHLVRDQGVGGSNPLSPTNFFT